MGGVVLLRPPPPISPALLQGGGHWRGAQRGLGRALLGSWFRRLLSRPLWPGEPTLRPGVAG